MSETWIQVIALFLANAGLIVWFRSESRSDWRLMDSKHESFRAEMGLIMREIKDDMRDFHTRLALQDQEFKLRLCSIEEKSREKK